MVVSAQSTNQPNITYSGGTGAWTTSLANTTWHEGAGKLIVITHVYQTGDTFPTVADGGATAAFSYIVCAYYGAAGVDHIGTITTANSPTINYPSVTPSQPSDEALFVSAIMSGATSFSNPSTLTTCSTTTDQVFERTVSYNSPAMAFYEVNLGPCSAAATGSQTLASSGSGDSIGVTILLSPTIAHLREAVGSNRFRNNTGTAYYLTATQPVSFDLATLSQGWVDVLALYSNWRRMEPNNCDEYSWDYLDNMILNARSLGLKVSLGIPAGNSTPCGGANEAPCTGFNIAGNNVPSWAFAATACDNNHSMVAGTDYITSMWTRPWGPPTGTVNLIFDPNNPYYQHEWDRAIAALGSRYSSTNKFGGRYSRRYIVSVKVTGENKDTPEVILTNGVDGSAIACNGTAAQCTAICGSSSCSRTLNDAAQWLAVGPGYTTSNFIPDDLEAAEQHFESSWSNAFPNAALMPIMGNKPCPPGTYITDTFTPDMNAYDLSNHPHVIEEMSAALGWSATKGDIEISHFLPFSSQPFLGIAYQTDSIENSVAGAQCASNGIYSTSNTQCLTPSVYAGLAHMMYPYIEFYVADWQNSKVQPWIKLVHDLAYKQ
jgi:hypothetical protein